jgi:hypothetical protein
VLLKTKLGIAATGLLLMGGATTASAAGGPNSPATEVTTVATSTTTARVFAVINANGTKARGRAVASTKHIDTGVYEVLFRRTITTCGWEQDRRVRAEPVQPTNNGVFVQTWNGAGTPTDLPFTVVVVCS